MVFLAKRARSKYGAGSPISFSRHARQPCRTTQKSAMNITNFDHAALREVVRSSARKSWFSRHRWMTIFVGLPTLLAGLYYGFVAAPVFVSQSAFVIKSP